MESVINAKMQSEKSDFFISQKFNIALNAKSGLIRNRLVTRLFATFILVGICVFFPEIFGLNNLGGNSGISFGIDLGIFNLVLSAVIITFILCSLRKMNNWWDELGAIFILAGGLSNFIERVNLGYIRDYVNFFSLWYFNIADLLIFIGACILISRSLWSPKKSFLQKKGVSA